MMDIPGNQSRFFQCGLNGGGDNLQIAFLQHPTLLQRVVVIHIMSPILIHQVPMDTGASQKTGQEFAGTHQYRRGTVTVLHFLGAAGPCFATIGGGQ